MGLLCMQCGDSGFTNAFVHCVRCMEFAVHRYCLDVIPDTFDEYVCWLCDDCIIEVRKNTYVRKRKAPCQAKNCNVLELGKGLTVIDHTDCVDLADKCSSQQLEKQRAKVNLPDKRNVIEKKKLITESTSEKDQMRLGNASSKQLLEKCENMDIMKRAKSSDSMLAKEVKEKNVFKQKTVRCLSERPCQSNTEPGNSNHIISSYGSVKSSREEVVMSSSELENQGSEMSAKVRGFRPRDDHEENRVSAVIAPYSRSNFGEKFAKDLSISPKLDTDACAEPLIIPIWRGSFEIKNPNQHIGIMAHMCNKACKKVYDEACQFQRVLQLEMLPKHEVWPKSFKTSEPSGENIALYFFPSKISERVFDNLVREMVQKELAMRGYVQNAELLLFPSTELPILYWRFQGKYYLWGVFKGKQPPPSQSHSSTRESEGRTTRNEDRSDGVILPVAKRGNARSSLSPSSYNGSFGPFSS